MKILQIHSGLRGAGSNSTKLASEIAARLASLHPQARMEVRDLAEQRVLDAGAAAAFATPAQSRTPEQAERVAYGDAAVDQLLSADILVIGAPLYNLDVPVQLKAWIDEICRAGVTFRYTEQGPVGLVQGKKVFVALARGGLYAGSPLDTQKPYLRNILGFLGMTDVTFVHLEGLAISPEAAEQAWARARAEIDALQG